MSGPDRVRIFLCGDVMTGRGIDQIMPHPCDPVLYESFVTSAVDYVEMAEAAHGRIPRSVPAAYIWGKALDELSERRADVRIINLETSITRSGTPAAKGINYRMSPENAACLSAAAIDCCVLANNHTLDWGRPGLLDTLDRLAQLKIRTAGAGRTLDEARAPAIVPLAKARVLIFSYASPTSGTPHSWAAKPDLSGLNILSDLTDDSASRVAKDIAAFKRHGDIVVVSIHWGANWGYEIPDEHRRFAHALVDHAGVSILHGHSAHHAKAIEIYRNRLILYGCGDFLNDYEGIEGDEAFRDDLAVSYFADVDPAGGDLLGLEMAPFQIRHFRLEAASSKDVAWLGTTLDRESASYGTRVHVTSREKLAVSWHKEKPEPRP